MPSRHSRHSSTALDSRMPIVSFLPQLGDLLHRFGLERHPSDQDIGTLSFDRLVVLQNILQGIVMGRVQEEFTIQSDTLLEIHQLSSRLLQRMFEVEVHCLYRAFGAVDGFSHLDSISLVFVNNGIYDIMQRSRHHRNILRHGFLSDLQNAWEVSLNILEGLDTLAPLAAQNSR